VQCNKGGTNADNNPRERRDGIGSLGKSGIMREDRGGTTGPVIPTGDKDAVGDQVVSSSENGRKTHQGSDIFPGEDVARGAPWQDSRTINP